MVITGTRSVECTPPSVACIRHEAGQMARNRTPIGFAVRARLVFGTFTAVRDLACCTVDVRHAHVDSFGGIDKPNGARTNRGRARLLTFRSQVMGTATSLDSVINASRGTITP